MKTPGNIIYEYNQEKVSACTLILSGVYIERRNVSESVSCMLATALDQYVSQVDPATKPKISIKHRKKLSAGVKKIFQIVPWCAKDNI